MGSISTADLQRKHLLRKALKLSYKAVHYDEGRDFGAAISTYRETCTILIQLTSEDGVGDGGRKLRDTIRMYARRISQLQEILRAQGIQVAGDQ